MAMLLMPPSGQGVPDSPFLNRKIGNRVQTILIVEDERALRDMVALYLEQEGFRVAQAANGQEALFVAREQKPDLIVLDLMMPIMNGHDFLRAYQKEGGQAPVIMLTARVEDLDKILGLELGADDYVTKPFNVRELVARVRAVLRRSGRSGAEPDLLRAADIVLDRSSATVEVGGRQVELTRSEFEMLATFMGAPGHVFSRLDLLDRMNGDAYDGYERTIDVHIRNLRVKIEPDSRKPIYIETVYGMGYRFAPQKPAKP
ncbi:MAG: response regulator transcription factor [Caldilineaceae bacterium]